MKSYNNNSLVSKKKKQYKELYFKVLKIKIYKFWFFRFCLNFSYWMVLKTLVKLPIYSLLGTVGTLVSYT